MLDVSQQVDGRTHLLFDEVARLFRRGALRKHLLVCRIDAQARTAIVSEIDYVLTILFELLNVDLRRD